MREMLAKVRDAAQHPTVPRTAPRGNGRAPVLPALRGDHVRTVSFTRRTSELTPEPPAGCLTIASLEIPP